MSTPPLPNTPDEPAASALDASIAAAVSEASAPGTTGRSSEEATNAPARVAWAQRTGADDYGSWAEFEVPSADGASVVQRLRWMPPGRFLMGSPEAEAEREKDEGPQQKVRITKGFWLFDTACTQALWAAVIGENSSMFRGADRRAEGVSFRDTGRFLQRINAMVPGLALRLPSEAEWEYACRAGTATAFAFGTGISTAQANYDGDYPYAGGARGVYREETVPVKSFPPNGWDLYEMHGNVWE